MAQQPPPSPLAWWAGHIIVGIVVALMVGAVARSLKRDPVLFAAVSGAVGMVAHAKLDAPVSRAISDNL